MVLSNCPVITREINETILSKYVNMNCENCLMNILELQYKSIMEALYWLTNIRECFPRDQRHPRYNGNVNSMQIFKWGDYSADKFYNLIKSKDRKITNTCINIPKEHKSLASSLASLLDHSLAHQWHRNKYDSQTMIIQHFIYHLPCPAFGDFLFSYHIRIARTHSNCFHPFNIDIFFLKRRAKKMVDKMLNNLIDNSARCFELITFYILLLTQNDV